MKLTPPEARVASEILKQLGTLNSDQAERVLVHVQDALDGDGIPMFSRGIEGPLGKLDRVQKTKIDEITDDLFRNTCHMRKTTTSAVMRDCIYMVVHQKTYGAMVLEKLNHDQKHIDAMKMLIGTFGATKSDGGQHD